MSSGPRTYVSDVFAAADDAGLRWDEHFRALQSAQTDIFGEMVPPGTVHAVGMPLVMTCPGGCILKFAPCEARRAWHYMTSGLAMPKDVFARPERDQRCGYGRELVISTRAEEAWPLAALKRMMSYVAGSAPDIRPFEVIQWAVSVVPSGRADMTAFVTLTSLDYPSRLLLPGGTCDLIHMIGATAAEVAYAKQHAKTRELGVRTLASFFVGDDPAGPVTDGDRPCLTADPDFAHMWERARAQAERA